MKAETDVSSKMWQGSIDKHASATASKNMLFTYINSILRYETMFIFIINYKPLKLRIQIPHLRGPTL